MPADADLTAALSVIDTATAATWTTSAQRNLLAVFRQQVTDYAERGDELLTGAARWIETHVDRWRREHAASLRRR